MNKGLKRSIAAFLSVLMMVTMIPFSAFAWESSFTDYVFGDTVPTADVAAVLDKQQPTVNVTVSSQDKKNEFYPKSDTATILNPAELKAGQKIAVSIELSNFDTLYTTQIVGDFNQEYLAYKYWKTTSNWTDVTSDSQCLIFKGGSNAYSDYFTDSAAATYSGTSKGKWYAAIACNESDPQYIADATTFNAETAGLRSDTQGFIIATYTLEVLKDCNMKDVIGFRTDMKTGSQIQWGETTSAAINTFYCPNYTYGTDKTYDNFPKDSGTTFAIEYTNYSEAASDHTVTYKDATGATISSETVADKGTPAQVPTLPTMTKNETQHTTYAWDVDPATASITADTVFTQVATAADHTWNAGVVTTPATCTTDGATTYTCTVCGQTKTAAIDKTGHSYGAWTHDAATTGATSTHSRVCANDASHTETANCSFTSKVTQEATYTQPEITTYTCSDCGYQYAAETAPALSHAHNYGAAVADYTSAQAYDNAKSYTHSQTCTADGTCNQPTKTTACTFDNGVVTKAATCTADGVITYTCSVCGGTYTVAIPMTGHSYGAWRHDAATSGAASTHTRVCANDASHTETVACNFTSEVTQNATVDQPEITTYTCKDCGYSYNAQTAPALDGATVTVTAADMGVTTLNGKTATAGYAEKVLLNSEYTLVATPNAGCEFVGWQSGNKIVSTQPTFTATAVADITYTPVFVDTTAALHFVFLDMFSNVISDQTVTSAADVTIPTAPTYSGYTFTGWSADADAIHNATASMTVYAQYEKDAAATYTVTADGATISYGSTSATGTLADVPYGAQVTVSKDGATAWQIDGKDVAYGSSYTFYVASNVTVTPVTTVVTAKPVVTSVSFNQVAGSYKVEFVASRSLADGCTFINAGWVYGKNLTDSDLNLAKVGKVGTGTNSGTVKATYVQSTASDTQFILSYGITAKSGTASAKAFMTYKDGTGVHTIYSDAMNHTYA